MMKSLDARKQGLDIKQYEKEILTPNEIDDFLAKIEELDSKEPDNSKRKILSDTKTTIAVDEDGKKILQSVPSIEGNIPRINHQIEKNDDRMMDIFLLDAIQTLKSDKDLSKHVEFAQLMSSLDKMYESTRGVIPFEVWVRNRILTQIKAMGIEENKYTAVNAILRNTEILSLAKENPNGIDILITRCLKEKTSQLIELGLTQEQTIEAISNLPELLYDEKAIQKIQFYQKHRPNHLKEYIAGNNTTIDEFIDTIIILQSINVDTSQLAQRDTIESLAEKSGVRREQIKVAGLNLENKIGGDRDRIVQAYRGNVKYKKPTDEQVKELQELGISLDYRDTTCEYVSVLKILKNNNINLEGLKVKSKIKDLIEGNPDENIIKQELLEISPEIDDGWNIGQRLFVQRKTYYDEFKIKLMNAISEGVQFTEKEIHILLDRDRGKDKSNSEEVIGFMRSIISEQKNVGELGENENLRTAFEATIKVSEERAIDQEKGEQ